MARLKKKQFEKLQTAVDERLLKKINQLLRENGVGEFKVKSLKLEATERAEEDCPEGYTKVLVCYPSGVCVYKCIEI